MKNMSSRALSLLFGILLSAGCSVKEYRESCPCRLVLDFSDTDTMTVRSADLYVTVPDGYVFTDHVTYESFRKGYEAVVPRTWLYVNLISGAEDMASAHGLNIPLGEECPAVYTHSSHIDADCEIWSEIVRMRKNHCRMNIVVKTDDSKMPDLKVMSDVCGYDVSGKPEAGDFEYEVRPDRSGKCSVTVPRQTDDGMILEIDDGRGVVKSFALGTYIASIGYDWTAPDLQDIDIELDFAMTRISLVVSGWDKEYEFDVVI